jgi:hypothetical protein
MVACGRRPCGGLLDGLQQEKLPHWRVRQLDVRQYLILVYSAVKGSRTLLSRDIRWSHPSQDLIQEACCGLL